MIAGVTSIVAIVLPVLDIVEFSVSSHVPVLSCKALASLKRMVLDTFQMIPDAHVAALVKVFHRSDEIVARFFL